MHDEHFRLLEYNLFLMHLPVCKKGLISNKVLLAKVILEMIYSKQSFSAESVGCSLRQLPLMMLRSVLFAWRDRAQ